MSNGILTSGRLSVRHFLMLIILIALNYSMNYLSLAINWTKSSRVGTTFFMACPEAGALR